MKIVFSSHLRVRLSERKIPKEFISRIFKNPEEIYTDTSSNYFIAIKKLKYAHRQRPMVLVYDIIEGTARAITIHPISRQQIQNKVEKGRWIEYEKT